MSGGATALLLAVAAVALVACSAEDGPGGGPVPVSPTADVATQIPATQIPTTHVSTTDVLGVSVDAYLPLFESVNMVTLDASMLLNQLAGTAAASDQGHAIIDADARILLGSFELQLDKLESAEPVTPELGAAHESLKAALDRYVEAASLLLARDEGGPDRFDLRGFQSLIQEGRQNVDGAGDAFP